MARLRKTKYDNKLERHVPGVLDTETGEWIPDKPSSVQNNTNETQVVEIAVQPGNRVTQFKPRKRLKDDFTLVFHATTRFLVEQGALDDNEKSLLFSMLIYADYTQYVRSDDFMYFNTNRIAELMKWSRQKTARVLDALVEKELLACTVIGRQHYYMFNPSYIYRGAGDERNRKIKLFEQAYKDNRYFHPEGDGNSDNSESDVYVTPA